MRSKWLMIVTVDHSLLKNIPRKKKERENFILSYLYLSILTSVCAA